MTESKLFKEFLICPVCEQPIMSKEEIANDTEIQESKYCSKCGKEIASTYKEALAAMTK